MGSITRPQLPELSVNASLEFWSQDPVIGPSIGGETLTQEGFNRLLAQRSEGGEEAMREGLRQAAEEADLSLEEHLRRAGKGILRDYDGQPDFFDTN
jgi:hypothetical protein